MTPRAPSCTSVLLAAGLVLLAAGSAEAKVRFGVSLDVGVPDGAQASLVVKPARWLGAHAGGGTNGLSPGVRAGLTVFPFRGVLGVTGEVGRYLPGDANGVARGLTGDPTFDAAILDGVGYDWASAHVGFEAGSGSVKLIVQGGASWIDARLGDPDPATGEVRLRGWVPSARIGLVVYLL